MDDINVQPSPEEEAPSSQYEDMFCSVDNPDPLQFLDSCLCFTSVEGIKEFNRTSQGKYRGKNPFPFRQLYIGHTQTTRFGSTYWIEMVKLLDIWGKKILTIVYGFDGGSPEMMYEYLIKYLGLVPNLLELVFAERDIGENPEAEMLRTLRKNGVGPLKFRMERKPLPELLKLRSIMFGNCFWAPLLEATMVKYGDTLRTVQIEGPEYDQYSVGYVDPAQFVAGRELQFKKYSCIYHDSSRIKHWDFQLPVLNELRLDYRMVNPDKGVENIFHTVNGCGGSIRRLHLSIRFAVPGPKEESNYLDLLPAGMKLELPHLEWLDFAVEWSKITGIDFLLPLVSLKEMEFSYLTMGSDTSARGGSSIIQFVGYRDQLYESNLWTLLPEIERLAIHSVPISSSGEPKLTNRTSTVHTRDGYLHHHSEQE